MGVIWSEVPKECAILGLNADLSNKPVPSHGLPTEFT